MKFAKLFDLKKGQVLVTRNYDDDDSDSPYKVQQVTEINGIRATIGFCFKGKKIADKCFNDYSEKTAQDFYNNMLETIAKSGV